MRRVPDNAKDDVAAAAVRRACMGEPGSKIYIRFFLKNLIAKRSTFLASNSPGNGFSEKRLFIESCVLGRICPKHDKSQDCICCENQPS
jgi:hypothetical protein